MPDAPILTAERQEDGTFHVVLHGAHWTHAQLAEAVARLQVTLSNADAADAEDAMFAGEG